MSCSVCQYHGLGAGENLHERISHARATAKGGCIHQATDLFVALLSCAAAHAKEEARDGESVASIVLSTICAEEDGTRTPVYEAAFLSSDEDRPLVMRRGEIAESPAQAVVNLLVQIHDEVLLDMSSTEVSH